MNREDVGNVCAADGWHIEWDLTCIPQVIRVFNLLRADHHISGAIDHRQLNRTIREFLVEHSACQLAFEV